MDSGVQHSTTQAKRRYEGEVSTYTHSPKISRARVPLADGADGSLVRNLVMTLK